MTRTLIQRTAVAAVLIGMAVLGSANSANAAFSFEITITDVTTTTSTTFTYDGVSLDLNNNPVIVVTANVGGFGVFLEVATTNTPGGPSISFLSQSGNTITNVGGGLREIKIEASATDYTSPTAPPTLVMSSALSGVVTIGNLTNVAFTSAIGTGNGLYEQSIVDAGITGQSASGPAGSLADESDKLIPNLLSPYSLTNVLTATFSNGAEVTNLAGTTTLTNVIPEPGSIVMAMSALPLVGFVAGFRRWRRREQA